MNDFLISIQDVKNYLFKQGYNSPSTAASDLNLDILRQGAADRIKSYLGYSFISASYSGYLYSGSDSPMLYTHHRPVTTLNSVKIDSVDVTEDIKIVEGGQALYYEGSFFPRGEYNIEVSYQSGWTRTTMPPSIRLVALKLCSLWNDGQNNEGTTSSSNADGTSRSFNFEREEEILSLIYRFKAQSW